MIYSFIFEADYPRIMQACIIDARATIPEIVNEDGFTIKHYVDSQIALIKDTSIVYKIERMDISGVLCGYFAIDVNVETKTAMLRQKVLRPAFNNALSLEIEEKIAKFIMSGMWRSDYLFSNN